MLDEATKADQSQWMRGQSGNAEGGGAGVVVRKTEPPPTGVVGVLGAVPKRAARGGVGLYSAWFLLLRAERTPGTGGVRGRDADGGRGRERATTPHRRTRLGPPCPSWAPTPNPQWVSGRRQSIPAGQEAGRSTPPMDGTAGKLASWYATPLDPERWWVMGRDAARKGAPGITTICAIRFMAHTQARAPSLTQPPASGHLAMPARVPHDRAPVSLLAPLG